jgi:hypothetical protein
LVQAGYFIHLPHEPKSSFDFGIYPIKVPQVGCAEREEKAELFAELGDMCKASPCDDSSHAMPNEVDDCLLWVFEITLDYLDDLVS